MCRELLFSEREETSPSIRLFTFGFGEADASSLSSTVTIDHPWNKGDASPISLTINVYEIDACTIGAAVGFTDADYEDGEVT